MWKKLCAALCSAAILLSIAPSTLTVHAATEDTAIIINAVGSTSVSYKSYNRGYPGTNNLTYLSGDHAVGYGENGLLSPQSDTTGSFIVPADGTYQFELKGGGGAAAYLDCAGGRCAFGGAGGHLIVNVPLKKGDVISYAAAAGGVQASYGYSVAYDGHALATSVGANGRPSSVWVNGVLYAQAGGGHGAYRSCISSWGAHGYKFSDLLKSTGHDEGTTYISWGSDDPAVGGKGGTNTIASGKGITVVLNSTGANGTATVLPGLSNTTGQTGLTKQDWYLKASGYSKDQTPGFVLISLNHEHTWETCDSACTEDGTKNRICTVCRGISYGTVTVPAHGHNFVSVELGDPTYKCQVGQTYFLSSSNSSSNKATTTWDGKEGYYWSKECTYCKGLADPVFAYKVIYDDGDGNQIKDPEQKYGGISYTPYSQEDTGWERPGYYIKYWYFKPQILRFTCHDPEWPAGTNSIKAQYKDLKTTDGVAILVAKWEPIKYTLRVHENYANTSDRTKDYTIKYDSDFKLPYPSPWSNRGTVIGYDFNKDTKVSPKYANQDWLRNLTTKRNTVIDIYTIWDLPPQVTSPSEIHLSKLKCAASALYQNNGTISKSDLEAELMTYATVSDYEWSARYTGKIQPGVNKGYTFGISSFEPGTIVDQATGQSAMVYYITFVCTDDCGQSSQSTTTLFIGDIDIDILVR